MASGVPVDVNADVSSNGSLDIGNLIPQILEKFVAVLEGAAIIALGVVIIRYIHSRLRKMEQTHEQQRNVINLLEKITSGFIFVISITTALKIVGIDMTLLVSVAILGLSYGLQDIIKNYVAGILILFKAPFKIGDVVKIRDFTGRVTKMDFQSTNLETFDSRHVTIYNSDVMTQSIVNFSNNSIVRIDFDVSIGYGSDIPKAIAIFQKIMENFGVILKNPKPDIIFKKFTETGPIFTLKFWIQKPANILSIKTQVASLIAQAFDEQNILMPYVKGIEAENEPALNVVTENRKARVQTFYQQPLFTMESGLQPQNINPEAEAIQNDLAYFAEEEPE